LSPYDVLPIILDNIIGISRIKLEDTIKSIDQIYTGGKLYKWIYPRGEKYIFGVTGYIT